MTVFAGWRTPGREEFAAGIAELGKIIGATEAVDPSWTRRLVLVDGSKWGILVDECAGNAKPYEPNYTTAYPVAYLLSEGVAVLQDAARNPELELARRRQEAKEAADRVEREREERAAEAKRKQAEAEQLKADRLRFQGDQWDALPPHRQLAYALALLVEGRDPELATNLRSLASQRCLDFPRVEWWRT